MNSSDFSLCGGCSQHPQSVDPPVLPFVFCRIGQPFMRTGLPLLLGMAAAFAGVATLAAVGGSWAVETNQYGRIAALVLLTLFAADTLSPNRLAQPSRSGHWWRSASVCHCKSTVTHCAPRAVALRRPRRRHGIAVGALRWPDPWPRPTGAALNGASVKTSLVLLGIRPRRSDISWAWLFLAGGRVFTVQPSLGAGEWLRRGLGVAVLAGVGRRRYGMGARSFSRRMPS